MTAQDCCIAALRQIGVIQPGETPSSDELTVSLDALNRMVSSWNDALQKALAGSYAASIYIFQPLSTYPSLGTNILTSQGWQRAYVFNLAMDLSIEFGRPPDPLLVQAAASSKQAILTLPAPAV